MSRRDRFILAALERLDSRRPGEWFRSLELYGESLVRHPFLSLGGMHESINNLWDGGYIRTKREEHGGKILVGAKPKKGR